MAAKQDRKKTKTIFSARSMGKAAPENGLKAQIAAEKREQEELRNLDVYPTLTNYVALRAKKISAPIRRSLANILRVPVDGPWEVTSSEPEAGLYVVGYRDDADLNQYGWLRGVVVDEKHGVIYATPYPYTPTAVTEALTPDNQGNVSLQDETGQPMNFNLNQATILRGFEGPQVMAIWHGGKFYLVSRKQLYSEKTFWPGCKKSVKECYDELQGPRPGDLFDTSKLYSPYSHTFIVSHPQFFIASKQDVHKGYVVYTGPVKNWDPKVASFPKNQVDMDLRRPEVEREMPDLLEQAFVYEDNPLSLKEANDFLRYGWLEPFDDPVDPRLRAGESIIVQVENQDKLYHIMSPAYKWRKTIRGDTPNALLRFYQLSEDAFIDTTTNEGFEEFGQKYAYLTSIDLDVLMEEIRSGSVLFTWPQDEDADYPPYEDKTDRLQLIWENLLIAMPVALQHQALPALQTFFGQRRSLADWVVANRPTTEEGRLEFNEDVPPYIQKLVKDAETFVSLSSEEGSDKNSNELFRDAVIKILGDTPGTRIYKMVEYLKAIEKTEACPR